MFEFSVQPVLIVGSGFSAFDAALHARKHKIPIIHQLRKNAVSVERLLNRTHYPEYFEVFACFFIKENNT